MFAGCSLDVRWIFAGCSAESRGDISGRDRSVRWVGRMNRWTKSVSEIAEGIGKTVLRTLFPTLRIFTGTPAIEV